MIILAHTFARAHTNTAFEPLSPFDAAATDDRGSHGLRESSRSSSGGGVGVRVPQPLPAPPMAAAAAAAVNPFFARLPGDYRGSARAANGDDEGAASSGVDLCGPVIKRSML